MRSCDQEVSESGTPFVGVVGQKDRVGVSKYYPHGTSFGDFKISIIAGCNFAVESQKIQSWKLGSSNCGST